MKYKMTMIALLFFASGICAWYLIVLNNSRHYMDMQIGRLKDKGYDGYMIYEYDYIVFDRHAGVCITVKARRQETHSSINDDGYHYIEIDYPIIPYLYNPMHRI
jgi:hypothetical protein